MNKLVAFLSILFLVVLSGLMVYFGGTLFDTSKHVIITPYVFQPAPLSEDRIGRPVPLENLSDEFVRSRLIRTFVNEYFYIVPDAGNVEFRMTGAGPLARMSSAEVFANWRENTAPEIDRLAQEKVLRRVVVRDDAITLGGQYYVVTYDLVTYNRPNDIDAVPKVTPNQQMYLRVDFERGVKEIAGGEPFDVVKYLKQGGNPAAIFKFMVTEIR